jgi:hypothetical protein
VPEVRGDEIAVLAVTIAKRVCDLGSGRSAGERVGRIDAVWSGFEFKHRGEHRLKGVPGTRALLVVKS